MRNIFVSGIVNERIDNVTIKIEWYQLKIL